MVGMSPGLLQCLGSILLAPANLASLPASTKMDPLKALMQKSAEKLLEKAADCFDLAEAQHKIAEKHHETASRQHCAAHQLDVDADKLEALGRELTTEAVELKGNTEVAPPMRANPVLPRIVPKAAA